MCRAALWAIAGISLGIAACGDGRREAGDSATVTHYTDAGRFADADSLRDTAAAPRTAGAGGQDTPSARSGDALALGAFIAASRHEIQHGRLAAQKGSMKEVRDLGTTVARDHDDLAQRAIELARKFAISTGVSPADTSMQQHAPAMADLRNQTGGAFDRAFLQHEADYNAWLIGRINGTMLPKARIEEVRTFLQQAIAVLEAHGKAAQDLQQQLRDS